MGGLHSALRWRAAAEGDRAAIFADGRTITYAQLVDRIDRMAAHLCAGGSRKGDLVALMMRNSPAFIELALAVSAAGAIVLPINHRLAAPEVGYIVDHSGASLLYADDDLAAGLDLRIPIVTVDEAARADSSVLALRGSKGMRDLPHTGPEDVFRLMYTSGTTDRPKGVIHTYANFFWKSLDHALVLGLSPADRLLVCGPLFHVGAFDLPGIAVLLFGGALCVHRDFDPTAVLDSIARLRLTGAWMAPAMLGRVLGQADGTRDLSSFRWCVGGGARTPEERIRQFHDVFPNARYVDSYGLTETCSGDTFMPEGREIEKIGSVGVAVPNVAITIRDDVGVELAPGEQGEICISGPKVSPGYWRDPERTRLAFHGSWFRTGDVGMLDAEGFLTVTDRKKDMIISGGENVASAEIERVIDMLPQVAEVAVVGVPDEQWGERPFAVVVLRAGTSLDYAELVTHCRAHLARFKLPAGMLVRADLPRSAAGKVLKRRLREELPDVSGHAASRAAGGGVPGPTPSTQGTG